MYTCSTSDMENSKRYIIYHNKSYDPIDSLPIFHTRCAHSHLGQGPVVGKTMHRTVPWR